MIIVRFLWRQQHIMDTVINTKIITTAKTITDIRASITTGTIEIQCRIAMYTTCMHAYYAYL